MAAATEDTHPFHTRPNSIKAPVRGMCQNCGHSLCSIVLQSQCHAGRLPRPIAAHLTPNGGWVEFHPDATLPQLRPPSSARTPADALEPVVDPLTGPITPPELQPLIWFRVCTDSERQEMAEAVLDPQCPWPQWWQCPPLTQRLISQGATSLGLWVSLVHGEMHIQALTNLLTVMQ